MFLLFPLSMSPLTFVSSVEIFTPFVHLPSRKLEDYYKIIRHPVSLKSVQKRAHGIHGRKDTVTGPTDFKSWEAFEEEVSFIWRNCREYNEDGSGMYELAGEFEVWIPRVILFMSDTNMRRTPSRAYLLRRNQRLMSQLPQNSNLPDPRPRLVSH